MEKKDFLIGEKKVYQKPVMEEIGVNFEKTLLGDCGGSVGEDSGSTCAMDEPEE